MNTDFVILRESGSSRWFWTGRRGWWSNDLGAAHVYLTREAAERSIRRNGFENAKYATVEELRQERVVKVSTRSIEVNLLGEAVEQYRKNHPGSEVSIVHSHIDEHGQAWGFAYVTCHSQRVELEAISDLLRLEFSPGLEGQRKSFHVFQNGQRNGVKGYVLVRTYARRESAQRFVERSGKPSWLLPSLVDYVPITSSFGGLYGHVWNSGAGWRIDFLPVLPLVDNGRR